jgi:malonyl-CoA decarboxylase
MGKDNPLTASEKRALASAGLRDGLAAALAQPWQGNSAWAEALRGPLMRLAAIYLTTHHERGGRALDPVAHFHLSNGARLERLNWLADVSEKGIGQSAGIMANYLYRLADIEDNHEAYTGQGQIVTSTAIRSLAKG